MLETFKKAFKTNHSSFTGQCNCGREFYNPDSRSWDFDDLEINRYQRDENNTELVSNVQYIEFNDRRYVTECDCWHSRANGFMAMLNMHDSQIAKYLNGERERKLKEAEQVRLIEILSDVDVDSAKAFIDDIPF